MGLQLEAGVEPADQRELEVGAVDDLLEVLLARDDKPDLALALVADHLGEAEAPRSCSFESPMKCPISSMTKTRCAWRPPVAGCASTHATSSSAIPSAVTFSLAASVSRLGPPARSGTRPDRSCQDLGKPRNGSTRAPCGPSPRCRTLLVFAESPSGPRLESFSMRAIMTSESRSSRRTRRAGSRPLSWGSSVSARLDLESDRPDLAA